MNRFLKAGFVAAIVALFGLTGLSVSADNFGLEPVSYEADIQDYFGKRLVNSRGAKFRYNGAPYKVYMDMPGKENIACWAVDVRVKSILQSGGYGNYLPYTVLIHQGEVVALKSDVRRVKRI